MAREIHALHTPRERRTKAAESVPNAADLALHTPRERRTKAAESVRNAADHLDMGRAFLDTINSAEGHRDAVACIALARQCRELARRLK